MRPYHQKLLTGFIATNLLAGLTFPFYTVQAATLSLSASTKNVAVGNTFTISAYINTQTKTINNAEASIVYPADLVEVVSVASQPSVFSLWVEQPTASNGVVSFNGGVPNPGYTGSGGRVVSATFRAKKDGTANFTFSGAAIRENDGLGTNVFTGQNGTTVEIAAAAPADTTKQPDSPKPAPTLTALVPTSPTPPHQTPWYAKTEAELNWNTPAGTRVFETYFGKSATAEPDQRIARSINEKSFANLEDGTYYFALRYQTVSGWSKTSRTMIRVDTTDPSNVSAALTLNNSLQQTLVLQATDAMSGVDHYDVHLDSYDVVRITPEATGPTTVLVSKLFPNLTPGQHALKVAAYDRAGNQSLYTTTVDTQLLGAPTITDYTSLINRGDNIVVRGSTRYPGARIAVEVQSRQAGLITFETAANSEGSFSLSTVLTSADETAQVTAYVLSTTGIKGQPSTAVTINILPPPSLAANMLAIYKRYSPIGAAILLLLSILGWARYFALKRRYHKVEQRSHQIFSLLMSRAQRQIAVLENAERIHGLTPQERLALEDLKEVMQQLKDFENGGAS